MKRVSSRGNPWHDEKGRFASGPSEKGQTVSHDEEYYRQKTEKRAQVDRDNADGSKLNLSPGCIVTIKPEWRNKGERAVPYVVRESYNDIGRCRIEPVESNMAIKPIETVDHSMLVKKYDPRDSQSEGIPSLSRKSLHEDFYLRVCGNISNSSKVNISVENDRYVVSDNPGISYGSSRELFQKWAIPAVDKELEKSGGDKKVRQYLGEDYEEVLLHR